MVRLEDFEAHLKHISDEDWNVLFQFIPRIESADTFGVIKQDSPLFLQVIPSKIVNQVMDHLKQMQLFPVFEWILWRDGRQLAYDTRANLSEIPLKELCMLLTVIFRLDRFNEGFLVSRFEDGTMLRILKEIRSRVAIN